MDSYRSQETPEELRANIDWLVIVSPSGTAHWGANGGDTDCGIIATGDNWWWPL